MNVTFTADSEENDIGFECNVYCGSRPEVDVNQAEVTTEGQEEEVAPARRKRSLDRFWKEEPCSEFC